VIALPSSVRIFVAAEAVDLRRGFDGLAALTRSVINRDPMCGHLFVFLNRRRDRVNAWLRRMYLAALSTALRFAPRSLRFVADCLMPRAA